jgi:hypothetical protein
LHKGLRVVSDGLTTGDKVVVNGLQRVRPGIEVKAETVPMPQLPGPPGQEVGSSEKKNDE